MAVPVELPLREQIRLSDMKKGGRDEASWPDEVFRQVFLENYAPLAGIVFRIVGEYSRAEDLATEAFWRLYHQPYNGGNFNPRGWLYRTATRLAIDSLRGQARRGRYEKAAGTSLVASPAGDPLEDVLEAERRAQVRKALACLRPEQAQLLMLRASGFSYQELSETLGVKAGTVGTRLIRAEAAFRKHYLGLFGK